jgi:cytochrome P450
MHTTEIDPFADAWLDDPAPAYAAIAALGPAVWCDPRGCWILTGYSAVRSALRDTTTFTSRNGIGQRHIGNVARPNLLTVDPPEHESLRSAMGRVFQAAMVRELEPVTRACCRSLLAEALARASFDLVDDFAALLPARVIGTMLGLSDAECDDIAPAVAAFGTTVDIIEAESERAMPLRAAYDQLDEVFGAVLSRAGETTPTTAALRAAESSGELTRNQALDYCALLFTAGAETTANLIASASLLLLQHGALASIDDDPRSVDGIVEEALRLEPPLQVVFRTATADAPMGDAVVRRGDRVGLAIVAANRDPQRFHAPNRFVPSRTPNPHLSFAHGVHHCLGAALARLESRIALQELAFAAPDLGYVGTTPVPRGVRRASRGPTSLEVARRENEQE